MSFDLTLECALSLDELDNLQEFRELFFYPNKNKKTSIYLSGNSLGLQPKSVSAYINEELSVWKNRGVFGQHERWEHYHERLTNSTAKIVGAKNSEVVVMNALTVNLHLLLISFYRPSKTKYKIIIETGAFPSDLYAIHSQVRFHGLDPTETIIEISPRKGEYSLRKEDIVKTIRDCDSLALVLIGGVNYYTGQCFDMKTITKEARQAGAIVGFDLAHAAGNVNLKLNEWDVDFATWCSYKYLCGGPGAPSGVYINERYHDWDGPRFEGWWGNDKSTRFKMNKEFSPIRSAEAWQISNAPIFGMSPLIASMEIYDKANIKNVSKKGIQLSSYFLFLLKNIIPNITVITPDDRGCQLSLIIPKGNILFKELQKQGVACDWREPNVIRFAPHPLYNSFAEIFNFVHLLKQIINEK